MFFDLAHARIEIKHSLFYLMEKCMGHRIETVVFDLDGTLYLNNDFYRDYIHFLLEDTDKVEWEDDLIRYTAGVCSGEHLVMNTYYRSGVIRSDSSKEFFSGWRRHICRRCATRRPSAEETASTLETSGRW